VVGPSGEHIHTDKYGRVKVQFHWDRIGAKNDKSSCWMRVSQPWAGNGFGIISIPRIGDEVVVSFLEGDPDQPIITGRVYNAEFMPPYTLPDHNHITTIFTRSVGSTTRAEANELKFCDKPGEEYILVQAQKDFHREVENDDHDRVKANQFIIVDGNREEKVAGTMDVTVAQTVKTVYGMDHQHDLSGDSIASIGGVYELKVGGEHKMDVGGDAGVKWGGKGQLDVGQDLAMSSGGNVDIKGAMNVTIEAGSTLTLKAGGCSIVLSQGSLTIDGPVVNINCGGSGSPAKQAAPAEPAAPIKSKEPEQKANPHP
jgi:type VI secretion system secreted protein VgrG